MPNGSLGEISLASVFVTVSRARPSSPRHPTNPTHHDGSLCTVEAALTVNEREYRQAATTVVFQKNKSLEYAQ